jgi:hypothetical protein
MDGLKGFLIENYLNLRGIADDKYFMSEIPYNKSKNKIYQMSAALTPEGIVTQQSPGESFEGLEKKLSNVDSIYRRDISGKFELGKKIDSIYQNFMNSTEGKEFVKYMKRNGNGTPGTGSIDDILIVNKGEGLVAATIPDALRKNLIINQDYINQYAMTVSSVTGLSYEKVVESIIAHELHHIYGQTRIERSGNDEKKIEFNNDLSLIQFYTGLAQEDSANSDLYLTKAKLFTIRYDGQHRQDMDKIIESTEKTISDSYSKAA